MKTSIKHITQILLTLIVVVLFNGLYAADFYSIKDGLGGNGNWNDGNYWSYTSGGSASASTPGQNDNIYIEEDIALNQSIVTYGVLSISAGKSLHTDTHNLEVRNGGNLQVHGRLEVNNLDLRTTSIIKFFNASTVIIHNDLSNRNFFGTVTIDSDINITGNLYNMFFTNITGSGSVTAGTYSGWGTTFGFAPNDNIPDGTNYPTALPIELVSFSAQALGNGVEVKWATASEVNNDYFTIERSLDGESFEIVTELSGAGNSNSIINYSIIDGEPYDGLSYYRLIQTDFDGEYKYSDIVSIQFEMNQSKSFFEIYPNLVMQGEMPQVFLNGFDKEKEGLIIVSNINGEQIASHKIYTSSEVQQVNLLTNNYQLKKGLYFITGFFDNEVYSTKLVVK